LAKRLKTVSLRWSLLRSFAMLILLSSFIVLGLTWFRSLESERHLSRRLIRQGTSEARDELDRFLGPADVGTRMAMAWGRAGLLRLDAVVAGAPGQMSEAQSLAARRLNSMLLPFVLAKPALSSVQIANARGQGFLVLILPDGSMRNRVVDRDRWGTQTLRLDLDREGIILGSEWKEVDYEPRKRSWYTEAQAEAAGQVGWTAPYTFHTTGDLGITSSGRWRDGETEHVVAYDVLLTALTKFTQGETQRVSPNAMNFIATSDWKALGLPRSDAYLDQAAAKAMFLKQVTDLEIPALKAAIDASTKRGAPDSDVFAFESGGEDWWVGLEAYPLGTSRRVWTAVLVPGRDLLEEVSKQRIFLLIATAAALIAAFLYSLLLARSYSRPLEALAKQSQRIQALDFRSDSQIEARLSEFQTLADAQQKSLAALQSFSRYVPVDVVRELVAAGDVAKIGGRAETLTVLFTDIAGFTSIAERMSPQALTNHMAEYFEAMIEAIQAHDGTVDKFVGDAIVAFWGAPRKCEDHARKAVEAVLECQARLEVLNPAWEARGLAALPTRFGMATGPVVVGNIGAPGRLAYTVLGDTVNFASRLEALNKRYGLLRLADQAVVDAAGSRFAWRRIDRVVVKGRTEETWIYEILGAVGEVSSERLSVARRYEAAWDQHAERKFEAALAVLDAILVDDPDDGPSLRLSGLCRSYIAEAPPDDWTPTTIMSSK